MKFDAKASLAVFRKSGFTPANSASPANREGEQPHNEGGLAELAGIAGPYIGFAKNGNASTTALPSVKYPHGQTPSGRPLTWTGKVVSEQAWEQLSAWERHGSKGLLFDGISQQWISPPRRINAEEMCEGRHSTLRAVCRHSLHVRNRISCQKKADVRGENRFVLLCKCNESRQRARSA